MINSDFIKLTPQPRPLKDGKEWHVFLSYRSVNRGWVLNLYDTLTELGFKVFLDQYVLKPGDALVTKLEDALEKSQAGILIWSTDARDSEWVRNEYNVLRQKATSDKSFFLLPVKIDATPLPTFAQTQLFLDFSNYPDGPRGGDLLRLVHGLVGQSLSAEAVKYAFQQDEEAKTAAAKIAAAIMVGNPAKLVALFHSGGESWNSTASLGCKVVEGLIKMKAYPQAFEVLDELQKDFPKSIRPMQLRALALTRRKENDDVENAMLLMAELYQQNHMGPETMGIFASACMKQYEATGNIAHLKQSRKYYEEAFLKSPDDYYTAINAASKSLFLKDEDKAKLYAEKTLELTGTTPVADDYWKTASIAEAFLLLKRNDEAMAMYRAAIDGAPMETGSHDSTRMQMENILKAQEADEETVKRFAGVFG
jgi:tetratricopeptide (TPR) repeat protein